MGVGSSVEFAVLPLLYLTHFSHIWQLTLLYRRVCTLTQNRQNCDPVNNSCKENVDNGKIANAKESWLESQVGRVNETSI